MLAEKNRLAEEEAMLLSRKACEVEQEIKCLRVNAIKTEEEKVLWERKTREAEILTSRLIEESKKRTVEAEKLKNELIHARVAEKEAKEKLLNFLSCTTVGSPSPPPPATVPPIPPLPPLAQIQLQTHSSQQMLMNVGSNDFLSSQSLQLSDNSSALNQQLYDEQELTSYELLSNGDISELSLEIEKERVEYLTKSKQVQNQLKELRSEIEILKICEKQSNFDKINAEQLRLGETKYSTLKKATKNSTKAKVVLYEEL